MENGEREVRVGSDAKARLKKKNKKREKAIKVGGCISGIGTSSDLTRRPMTPTKEKAKCHTRMGEAAVGAAGAAGGKKVKGSEEGRAISLPSVSGNKRPREGEEVGAAVQGGTSKSKHHPFPTECGTSKSKHHPFPTEGGTSKSKHHPFPTECSTSKSKHHPFPTEYGDHFETPLQAYRDVEGALAVLSKLLSKKKKHLRIWDPYYCAGRTPRLLAQLGFHKVEHSNQDFYKVVREKRQPKHDVLITNPPYSGDHKKRCLEYCRASGKPWFLLVPNYVATKDYYRLAVLGEAAGPGGEPFYVVPETKYSFDHPEGTGHADSPFSGVWYVHCGSHTEAVFKGAFAEKRGGVSVLRSLDELSRTGTVSTERRLNPRQRKALKKKRSAAAAARLS